MKEKLRERVDWEILPHIYLHFLNERTEMQSRGTIWRANGRESSGIEVRHESLVEKLITKQN